MNKEHDRLLAQIAALCTGDFEADIVNIGKALIVNFDLVHDDDFLLALEEELHELYPEQQTKFREIFHRLDEETDDAFQARMLELLADGEAHQARFEMEAFIRVMEEDFDSYHPKPYVKYLSIFDPLAYFSFKINERPGTHLVRTRRDYPSIYLTYAKILLALNERKEAAEAYQQAILWNPYAVETIYELTKLYQDMEQFGMSYATLLNGLEYSLLRKNLAQGYYYLARFYDYKGKPEVSYQFYSISLDWQERKVVQREQDRLAEREPESAKIYNREDREAFMASYKVAGYPSAELQGHLLKFAQASMLLGDLEAAQCYFETYADLYPEDTKAYERDLGQVRKIQQMLAYE